MNFYASTAEASEPSAGLFVANYQPPSATDQRRAAQLARHVAQVIGAMNPGTLITWEAIQQMIGATSKEQVGPILAQARKVLKTDYGYFLESIRGKGYRIVQPGQEVTLVLGQFERAKRIARNAVADSMCIVLERLDDQDRSVAIEVRQRLCNRLALLTA